MNHDAIYAGTFDPLTLGHQDLIERAGHIFENVVVAVVVKPIETTMFGTEQRLKMVEAVVKGLPNVDAVLFDGLLVDFARSRGVHVLVRGLRAYSDFEYEFQMALTNRKLAPHIETLFLMPKEEFSYISSSTVREIVESGGDASQFVPAPVNDELELFIEERGLRG